MTVTNTRVNTYAKSTVTTSETEVVADSSTALIDKLQTGAVAEQLARLLLGNAPVISDDRSATVASPRDLRAVRYN